jgi:hypothetical protein
MRVCAVRTRRHFLLLKTGTNMAVGLLSLAVYCAVMWADPATDVADSVVRAEGFLVVFLPLVIWVLVAGCTMAWALLRGRTCGSFSSAANELAVSALDAPLRFDLGALFGCCGLCCAGCCPAVCYPNDTLMREAAAAAVPAAGAIVGPPPKRLPPPPQPMPTAVVLTPPPRPPYSPPVALMPAATTAEVTVVPVHEPDSERAALVPSPSAESC